MYLRLSRALHPNNRKGLGEGLQYGIDVEFNTPRAGVIL